MMEFRNTASFGKRQEYIAVAELLRRHFDVYMTLVDDQQIDCVIRQEKGGKLRYLDIQIKARSSECAQKNAGTFAAMEIRNPRENYYFIFYSEQANMYWVMPSIDLIREARQNKLGKNRGKYTIIFCNVTAKGVMPRPRFKLYENAFERLNWETGVQQNKPASGSNEPISDLPDGGNEPPKILPPISRKASCWDDLKRLEGKTIQTLAQHKPFRVLSVTDKRMKIETGLQKLPRNISIDKEIEPAYRALLDGRVLSLRDVRYWSEMNTAFVSAVLSQLPGVKYSTSPIRLWHE